MPFTDKDREMLIETHTNTEFLIKRDEDKETRIRSLEKWKWLHLAHLPGVGLIAKMFLGK